MFFMLLNKIKMLWRKTTSTKYKFQWNIQG